MNLNQYIYIFYALIKNDVTLQNYRYIFLLTNFQSNDSQYMIKVNSL